MNVWYDVGDNECLLFIFFSVEFAKEDGGSRSSSATPSVVTFTHIDKDSDDNNTEGNDDAGKMTMTGFGSDDIGYVCGLYFLFNECLNELRFFISWHVFM